MASSRITLRSVADLAAAGLVPDSQAEALASVAARYAVAVTPAMQALMQPGDAHDPIARQFIPSVEELHTSRDERADPIGDDTHSPLPGLVHRYPDRVLLKLVSVCPVYCRFCFRRETVGPNGAGAMSAAHVEAALAYIAARPAISEVILTGGDPFMISARRAAELTAALAGIAHVKVLRWHTRVPIAEPERVTTAFARALRAESVATYVAVHTNHPRELTPATHAALTRLADAGLVLLSQTVLLRGINDDAAVLAELLRALVASRVKPYYLHHPDLAPGTSHFRLSLAEGQAVVRALRGRVSGLCQPTYVLDIPDGHGKVPVGPVHVAPDDAGHEGVVQIEDYRGGMHAYPAPGLTSELVAGKRRD